MPNNLHGILESLDTVGKLVESVNKSKHVSTNVLLKQLSHEFLNMSTFFHDTIETIFSFICMFYHVLRNAPYPADRHTDGLLKVSRLSLLESQFV